MPGCESRQLGCRFGVGVGFRVHVGVGVGVDVGDQGRRLGGVVSGRGDVVVDCGF